MCSVDVAHVLVVAAGNLVSFAPVLQNLFEGPRDVLALDVRAAGARIEADNPVAQLDFQLTPTKGTSEEPPASGVI